MTSKLTIDAAVMAKAYWPGLQAVIGQELEKAIKSDVEQLARQYYQAVTYKLKGMNIVKAEFVDGKLLITIDHNETFCNP